MTESEVSSARPALPALLRLPSGIMAILATLVVTVLGVVNIDHDTPGRFDALLMSGTVDVQPPLRYLALVIDFTGEPAGAAMVLAALVAACLRFRRRRIAVLVVAGAGLTVAVTTLLKPVVGRTIHGSYLSYPSGHTALATALALVLALLIIDLRQLGRVAGIVVVLTAVVVYGAAAAWSQVALGAHYPTDTVGGFCAALAIVPATALLIDRIAAR